MKKVAVVMGAKGDLPVVKPAMDMLETFRVPYEVRVLSAHRVPLETSAFARGAASAGFGALIAAAGKAAHLAGALAAQTVLPVIGIPIKASALDGMDALLATVQMPTGVPVATVAIDGAANAALLAIQILAVSDEELSGKLLAYKAKMADNVRRDDEAIDRDKDGV
ncbi:MAG: 5-(carboxyamino)imidazole ribonucleotide mutase [Oscillospiraceae bacterium]|nr:5-(carboxyamino)imidazole ribonucleotide mutase [Oscillospiraceae bacterium]